MDDFLLLLVEDKAELRDQLAKALKTIPYVKVEDYGDVQSATNRINELALAGAQFDAAVLDFKLPPNPDEHEDKADFTLCQRLRPRVAIWHITAYRRDPEIETHIERYHSLPHRAPRIIEKDVGFTNTLVNEVRQALPAQYIYRQLNTLLLSDRNSARAGRGLREGSGGSLTSLMANVCADISRFWHELHPQFQAELKESFIVDESTAPVGVYPS